MNRLSLAEFRQLVVEKINPAVFDPKRLAWILSFIPPVFEVRRCSKKNFFWDSLILHAHEIPFQLPALPVLEKSKLNLGAAIIQLKHYFQDDCVIFCTALINSHPSLIFNQQLYGQVQAFYSAEHSVVMRQIELFWVHLEDPKDSERLAVKKASVAQLDQKKHAKTRESNRVNQQASRAQMSPEKYADLCEKTRKRIQASRAAMSPEKAAKEQASRRDRQRNLTAQKAADIKEFTDPLKDNAGARGVDMTEICHPSHFKNSQQCPLKNLVLFCFNSGLSSPFPTHSPFSLSRLLACSCTHSLSS